MPASVANQIEPVQPNCRLPGIPDWHYHGSSKMCVTSYSEAHQFVLYESDSATLRVSKFAGPTIGWMVKYGLIHGPHGRIDGQVWMSADDLATAFGLSDDCSARTGQTILNMYGGDVAKPGTYLRFGACLNVPGPGTGYPGDPNISILLTDELKNIVRKLLAVDG
jgi:hypothetical protein